VTGLTLAVVLQASLLLPTTTTTTSYTAARKACDKTGRPMIVLVGADWCPACVEMKNNIIPKIRRRGLLRRVAFAEVNVDHHQKLGRELTDGGPIPQVVMYRKTRKGWLRRRLIGGQSAETVSAFIEEGIRLNQEAKKAKLEEAKTQPLPEPAPST